MTEIIEEYEFDVSNKVTKVINELTSWYISDNSKYPNSMLKKALEDKMDLEVIYELFNQGKMVESELLIKHLEDRQDENNFKILYRFLPKKVLNRFGKTNKECEQYKTDEIEVIGCYGTDDYSYDFTKLTITPVGNNVRLRSNNHKDIFELFDWRMIYNTRTKLWGFYNLEHNVMINHDADSSGSGFVHSNTKKCDLVLEKQGEPWFPKADLFSEVTIPGLSWVTVDKDW